MTGNLVKEEIDEIFLRLLRLSFSVFSSKGLWMQWYKINISKMPLLFWHSSVLRPPRIPHCLQHNVLTHSPGIQSPSLPSQLDHTHHNSLLTTELPSPLLPNHPSVFRPPYIGLNSVLVLESPSLSSLGHYLSILFILQVIGQVPGPLWHFPCTCSS